MKLDTKEKYDKWVLRKKHTKKRKHLKTVLNADLVHHRAQVLQAGHASKPNHHERFANITDCWPLLRVGHAGHNCDYPIERAKIVSKL